MPARTALTLQVINVAAGQAVTFVPVDSVNGMQVQNTGRVAFWINTTGTGGVTVAISSVACIHGRLGNVSTIVPASTQELFGPFGDPTIWGDGRSLLFVDFSAVIGGTSQNSIAAVQMV
jgi:hypothetical protein